MASVYSYDDQRRDIQRDINSYFGRPIEITPRAMAALEGQEAFEKNYGEDELLGVYAYCVMDALLRSSAVCALALFHAGVELEKLSFGLQSDRPAPLAMSTLEILFEGEFDDWAGTGSPHHWTSSARGIRTSGILTDRSILISAVEAALHGEEYMDIGTTLVVQEHS